MDWYDFVRPYGFHVRIYDSNLLYKVHNAVPYKSSSPNHLIYNIMRSPYRIDAWLTDDGIVTRLDTYGQSKYQHFSKECSAEEIVCGTLSQLGNIVTTHKESIQPGLF